jgi:iron complex transport system ATP-binding protein
MEINLELKQVQFAYLNRPVLKDINLSVKPGEIVGLLGPNGSGKTTLIKIISGILRPKSGEIKIGGTALSKLNRKSIARLLAVVPQEFNVPFAFTVEEIVTLGRTPFLKPLAEKNEKDRRIIDSSMELVGITGLKLRRFDELSGGERQKVVLAMALAQQPGVLLLDEPTVHLDINHQVQILELVRQLNTSTGLTVVAAMHDLNLAALYFNRLVLLKNGKVMADGTPGQVLTKDIVENVFGTHVMVDTHPVTGDPHIIITRNSKVKN